MALKYIDQIDLKGKKVIARFDFNVPFDKKDKSKISDTTRMDSAMQTIRYILEHGASKLIMMSHLGRPDGQVKKEFSLAPVAKYLSEKLGQEVILTQTALDSAIPNLLKLPTTKIVLLENIRFHAEEEENYRDFAQVLAGYGDIYINDAFGTAHRKHASTYEIVHFFKNKCAAGFLMKKEVEALGKVVDSPAKPFVAIVGGAKVGDKIKIIERLLSNCDTMLIGGAMAYPFLKAQGHMVAKSLCAEEDVALARMILNDKKTASKIVLPADHVISTGPDGKGEVCPNVNMPEDKMGLDIGPKTIENYKKKIMGAKTVLWNGPMGYFESAEFAKGTMDIARALAECKAFTVIGGGDSVSAVNKAKVADRMGHVSTGGGASLEFIEQGTLPGVQALKFGVE